MAVVWFEVQMGQSSAHSVGLPDWQNVSGSIDPPSMTIH